MLIEIECKDFQALERQRKLTSTTTTITIEEPVTTADEVPTTTEELQNEIIKLAINTELEMAKIEVLQMKMEKLKNAILKQQNENRLKLAALNSTIVEALNQNFLSKFV